MWGGGMYRGKIAKVESYFVSMFSCLAGPQGQLASFSSSWRDTEAFQT